MDKRFSVCVGKVLSPDDKLALVVVLGFCWSERERDASATWWLEAIDMMLIEKKEGCYLRFLNNFVASSSVTYSKARAWWYEYL